MERQYQWDGPDPTIQSQYSASATIKALAEGFRKHIRPDADIELFYRTIFDIETAEGIGLDIWGRILGIGREINVDAQLDYFGFEEADYDPFDNTPFYNGEGVTNFYSLDDEAYRALLMWKAAANIATSDAASLNFLLSQLFPGKEIVVHEAGIMAIDLFIYFPLEPWQRAILKSYGLMGRGAGVLLNWVEIPLPVFGFNEADYEPFDSAPFWQPLE